MFVTDPAAFLAAFSQERFPPRAPASARAAFLVSPAATELARESARDNRYMDLAAPPDPERMRRQHAELVRALGADLPVFGFPGDPACPDDLFPNNVYATTCGRLLIGRMRHAVRQREAQRSDIRGFFRDLLGYASIDLSGRTDLVAELTGALVIDRARGIGFCGLSERCDLAGARAMHAAFGLRLTFAFELAPGEYHTNVVLALLAGRLAVLAPQGLREPAVAEAILAAYPGSITLDGTQKRAFAGNAIALTPGRAWFSTRGADALRPDQRAALARAGFTLGTAELDAIECAGGSLRCCVAEIF
ncbi:arginine deiminase-related protein [Dokdonella sp.]|uniref:arginine deiminase-related protein n=1 Tax=Dokdonella sp. TaxID=2291710 RepID=UPI0031C484F2|nr:arginine deiminase-related protein [Dokdonella sp.]